MKFLDKNFIRGADLTTRRIAGETLIVPVRGHVGDLDAIFTLNDVGSKVWQLIDEPMTLAEIASAITDEYQITQSEAERDVVELLLSMEAAGLIREVSESES